MTLSKITFLKSIEMIKYNWLITLPKVFLPILSRPVGGLWNCRKMKEQTEGDLGSVRALLPNLVPMGIFFCPPELFWMPAMTFAWANQLKIRWFSLKVVFFSNNQVLLPHRKNCFPKCFSLYICPMNEKVGQRCFKGLKNGLRDCT